MIDRSVSKLLTGSAIRLGIMDVLRKPVPSTLNDEQRAWWTEWQRADLHFNFPDHFMPMARMAVERNMTLLGFDVRTYSQPDVPELAPDLLGISWQDPRTSHQWEERFTRVILGHLNPQDPEDKALVIAGQFHVEKAEVLQKMGGRLSRTPGLTAKTVLVEIGWGAFRWPPESLPDKHLRHLLHITNLPVVAVNDTAAPPLGRLQVDRGAGPDGRVVPVILSENFDQLIYFGNEQDITEYPSPQQPTGTSGGGVPPAGALPGEGQTPPSPPGE